MRQLPLAAGLALAWLATEDPARVPGLARRATLRHPAGLADWRLLPLDERAGSELFAVDPDGSFETVRFERDPQRPPERVAGTISDPSHAAIALAPLRVGARAELLLASPRGVERVAAAPDGGFTAAPTLLVARARMRLRTGRPVFVPFATDVNGDGLTDLVVQNGEALDVWIQGLEGPGDSTPRFTKAASVKVRVSTDEDTDASLLSDELVAGVTVPGLSMSDVDGDGRADLLVEDGEKHAFHLVRADGTIAPTPDVSVDLGVFRDTTPRADLTLGRTLAGSDKAVYQSRDLDRDGIPDYVIAHRRKVWVFHGTKAGPQFTDPTTILKAADDVTALLVVDLDQDARPDLLLVKVQVPSLATILRGLVAEWSVDVDLIGYQNSGERAFATTPKWRNTLSFQVPAITTVLKDPEKIVRRFEGVGRKFRAPLEGDFDGDGSADLALVDETRTHLDVWRGDPDLARRADEPNEVVLRRVLFEDENRTWDLERLLQWIEGYGERKIAILTGGREPATRFALRDRAAWRLESIDSADLDGDGGAEIVLVYAAPGSDRAVEMDVLSWR